MSESVYHATNCQDARVLVLFTDTQVFVLVQTHTSATLVETCVNQPPMGQTLWPIL